MKTRIIQTALILFMFSILIITGSASAMNLYVTSEKECYVPEDAGYTSTVSDISSVYFGSFEIMEATLSSGDPVHLSVSRCYNGQLGVWVPWSEAVNAMDVASINFFNGSCDSGFPREVEVTLVHSFACTLSAYDVNGVLVDTATADQANQSSPQILTLNSAAGIQKIEMDGAEICILEVCLACDEHTVPDPEPHDCPPEIIQAARQEGYDEGYMAGLAAAANNNDNSENCAAVNETLDIIIPCVDYNGYSFPVELNFTGNIFTQTFTWSLIP